MKYTIEKISKGVNELILKYQDLTPEVTNAMNYINAAQTKLIGMIGDTSVIIQKPDILYIESVDRKTFVYTATDVYRVDYSLLQMEEILNTINYFRCSKSMIINIDKIRELRSLASNRIDATLCNGEHVMISRTYATDFRKILKGEPIDD